MAKFCVFTPTYNRSSLLVDLYKSLERQTYRDFRWMVVDDGSTDDTGRVIADLKSSSTFEITYIRTENGGKQRATNLAVSLCDDELFYGVDSDDFLEPDALERLCDLWARVGDDETIAGMIALYGKNESEPIGTWMPENIERANLWDLYYKYGFRGDASQVYRTKIMKMYPYPIEDGEKFISECISTYRIAQDYDMALLNSIVSIHRYQAGGYTDNSHRLIAENPLGYCKVKRLSIEMSSSIAQRFYHTVLYLVGCSLTGKIDGLRTAPDKVLALIGYLPSKILLRMKFRNYLN